MCNSIRHHTVKPTATLPHNRQHCAMRTSTYHYSNDFAPAWRKRRTRTVLLMHVPCSHVILSHYMYVSLFWLFMNDCLTLCLVVTSNIVYTKPFLQLFCIRPGVIIRPNNDDDCCFYSSVWFQCVYKLDNRSVIENSRSEQKRTNNVVYPVALCSTDKWPHIPENE